MTCQLTLLSLQHRFQSLPTLTPYSYIAHQYALYTPYSLYTA